MKLNCFPLANSNWDAFTGSTDAAMHASIRASLMRIGTYSPYFDAKLKWFPEALVYFDSYAIYLSGTVATAHPEWVLKDSAGNMLYIPFACADGKCPQYAGDVSNHAFRAYQIDSIKTYLAANGATPAGYQGVWLDDVNLPMRVSDGSGNPVVPIDVQTGKPMLATAWSRYFAEYVELIRAELPPTVEILHNSIWYAGNMPNDPSVRRQIAAADYIYFERGFGDSGIIGGTGPFSLAALMDFMDYVHNVGPSVVIGDYAVANQLYSVACAWLVNRGTDAIQFSDETPANWNASLYDVELGPAVNVRHKVAAGVWQRDFRNGFVLVAEPLSTPQTIFLPDGVTDTNGTPVQTVTLPAMSGGVYLYTGR